MLAQYRVFYSELLWYSASFIAFLSNWYMGKQPPTVRAKIIRSSTNAQVCYLNCMLRLIINHLSLARARNSSDQKGNIHEDHFGVNQKRENRTR
jgi:hypothetical protein